MISEIEAGVTLKKSLRATLGRGSETNGIACRQNIITMLGCHDAPIRLRSSSPITQRTDREVLNDVVEIDQVVETGGTWV